MDDLRVRRMPTSRLGTVAHFGDRPGLGYDIEHGRPMMAREDYPPSSLWGEDVTLNGIRYRRVGYVVGEHEQGDDGTFRVPRVGVFVCEACGTAVLDLAAHTDWHAPAVNGPSPMAD